METAPLKSFATWARTELITQVSARIAAVLAPASPERTENPRAIRSLETDIGKAGGDAKGKDAVADKVAYTWFNRIIALRFMDANGYTNAGVVSPAAGQTVGQPEVLADAKRGTFDPDVVNAKIAKDVTGLLDGTRSSTDPQGEAYTLLLAEYSRYWNKSMPFMFEREGDYTELLIPSNLLADESILARAVTTMTSAVCEDVEVIGWLYQFYISERKDEVFAGFKKNKKAGAAEIPAATQLFTPHWIVRYLVENSVGRLWMLNHPESRLVDQMDYYIAPVDEETDFLKLAGPEELTVIDPACGSGHMLTYAFDLLYAIYEEEGYSPSEIPSLILTHNLYGTEIDLRAGELAAFALTMKGREKHRSFLNKNVRPNICVIEPLKFRQYELEYLVTRQGDREVEERFWNQFEKADVLGSLIQPNPDMVALLAEQLGVKTDDGDLLYADSLARAKRTIEQAQYLSRHYAAVVANPPYMGAANMGGDLAEFGNTHYRESKNDLFAMFIERCLALTVPMGIVGMITMQSWMFLSAFRSLRSLVLSDHAVDTIAHLGPGAFDSIGGEVVTTAAFTIRNGVHTGETAVARLGDVHPANAKEVEFRSMLTQADDPRWFRKDLRSLLSVPRSPFAYWFSDEITSLFGRGHAVSSVAETAKGMVTADNNAFIRQWWEVSFGNIGFQASSRENAEHLGTRWFPYARGGSYRKWFGNIDAVVDWLDDGRTIQTTMTPDGSRVRATNTNLTRIFKRGISWSSITTGRPSFRLVDQGHLYDAAGGICQSSCDSYLLALLNSRAAETVLHGLNPTINLPPDYVGAVPVPDDGPNSAVDDDVAQAVRIQREEWASHETTWEFDGLMISGTQRESVAECLERRRFRFSSDQSELAVIERRLDTYFDTAFGIVSDQAPHPPNDWAEESYVASDGVRDLVSYAIGCMFGRYSLHKPGLILADQGATLQVYSAKVSSPMFMPDVDNVIPIVDGDWFEDDIVARFRAFLHAAFGKERFEENLRFVEDSLGVKKIRDYFITRGGKSKFYEDHVKRYKKRPIYWMFSSPKGSFNALIYMHRYNPSTVSTVLNDYLREYEAKLEASLHNLEREANGEGSPRQQAVAAKEAERLRKILVELSEYEHEVMYPLASEQVAIDLDDGVKSNYPKFGSALKKIQGL